MATKFKYAIGYSITDDRKRNRTYLKAMASFKDAIHDIHFAHYNSEEIASGRFLMAKDPGAILEFVDESLKIGIMPTLLMNYLLHDNLDLVIKVFEEEYYSRGLRSVVVADINLIKRLRDKFPDLYIQGSVLSYRATEAELEEERQAGVDLHNPMADIIRNPNQIIANHNAGYKQKIMPFEGCFNKCPHERKPEGHRWHIARGLGYAPHDICSSAILTDLRLLFRANWVPASRVTDLAGFIEVVKMPRGTDFMLSRTKVDRSGGKHDPATYAQSVSDFIDIVENGKDYNVLDFNAVSYCETLSRIFRTIPAHLFGSDFVNFTDTCGGRCEELGCHRCWDKAREMSYYIKDSNQYEIRGVSLVKKR